MPEQKCRHFGRPDNDAFIASSVLNDETCLNIQIMQVVKRRTKSDTLLFDDARVKSKKRAEAQNIS
jgi:hypothetical protein